MSVFHCVAVAIAGNLAQFIVLWFLDMFQIISHIKALIMPTCDPKVRWNAATNYIFSGHRGQLQGQHNVRMNKYARKRKIYIYIMTVQTTSVQPTLSEVFLISLYKNIPKHVYVVKVLFVLLNILKKIKLKSNINCA